MPIGTYYRLDYAQVNAQYFSKIYGNFLGFEAQPKAQVTLVVLNDTGVANVFKIAQCFHMILSEIERITGF